MALDGYLVVMTRLREVIMFLMQTGLLSGMDCPTIVRLTGLSLRRRVVEASSFMIPLLCRILAFGLGSVLLKRSSIRCWGGCFTPRRWVMALRLWQ